MVNPMSVPPGTPLSADETIESLRWAHELGEETTRIQDVAGHPVLLSNPNKVKPQSLEEFSDKPYRVRESRQLIDVPSFVGYFRRQVGEMSTTRPELFGSIKGRSVTAIFDYHSPETGPEWCSHKATLISEETPEWTAFKKVNGKLQSQTDFAEFIERWRFVITDPDAATIIEIACNLEGSTDGTFTSKINRQNGTFTLAYEEKLETGKVKVPDTLTILIQPFYNSEPIAVAIPLRIRVPSGKPLFMLDNANIERDELYALKGTFNEVSEALDQLVLVGP